MSPFAAACVNVPFATINRIFNKNGFSTSEVGGDIDFLN